MKKLFKIPALLFAIMLIVSSCGNETKSDSGRNAEEDAKTVNKMTDWFGQKNKAKEAEGTKQIKLYKKLAVDMQNGIDVFQYYMENEDGYDDFIVEVKYVNPELAKNMGEYERFKRKVEKEIKKMKENLDGVNEGIEELKDED
jgi:hypothetical protein